MEATEATPTRLASNRASATWRAMYDTTAGSALEAVEAKPTKEFDAKMGNPDEFVRRAFESLWAYVTPDA